MENEKVFQTHRRDAFIVPQEGAFLIQDDLGIVVPYFQQRTKFPLDGGFITEQIADHRTLIKGVVCGIRVEEIEDPLMREIRYLDKLSRSS